MSDTNIRIAFVAILIVMHSDFASGHEPTAQLMEMDNNTWQRIDASAISAPLDIMAYSSGWYDGDTHNFCIFGGGHFNYSGNDVWCLDIATLKWRQLYEPDIVTRAPYTGASQGGYENYDNEEFPGVLFDPAGEPLAGARPFSRHTYDLLEYAPGFGMLMWGGYAWGDSGTPWCVQCPDTWTFDIASASWQYLFDGANPSPNKSPGVGASAWSSVDEILYAKVLAETWTYDPKRNDWQRIKTSGNPPWTIEGTLEYDPNHHSLYFFGGNYESNTTLWRFDIGDRKWTALNPAGDGPLDTASSGPGLAYDSHNDILAIYFGGRISVYDPDLNSWTSFEPEERPSDATYVFGRFRYDPVNRGFWLHTAERDDHATWFFRYVP